MLEILVPLTREYTLVIPEDLTALIAWVIGFAGIILFSIILSDRKIRVDRPFLIWSAILSVLILVLTPFLGILPRLGVSVGTGEVPVQHLMFFAAVPWMVAGGVLGVIPATVLAGLSGLLLAYLDTHNIFTPLVLMSAAVVFSWCIRQRFRTPVFKWLRFPVVAAILSLITTVPIIFLTLILSTPGTSAARIGTAVARFPMVVFALGGMVLMGGVVCVIVQAFAPSSWGSKLPLKPSPGELNISFRILLIALSIFILAVTGIFVSTWRASNRHSRQMMVKQMTDTSHVAGHSLAIFLQTGEEIIQDLALTLKERSGSPEDVNSLFAQNMQVFPFFDQIALLSYDGGLAAGSAPALGLDSILSSDDDVNFASVFADGKPRVLINSIDESQPTWAVFALKVEAESEQQAQVLWAETILENNRFAQSFIQPLDVLIRQGGFWQIVGADGRVLITRGNDELTAGFVGSSHMTSTFYQSKTDQGQTLLHYYQPIDGTNWGISVTLPSFVYQEQAWQATYPVVLIFTGAFTLLFLVLWFGLAPVVKEMDLMAKAIHTVASGDYDHDEMLRRSSGSKGRFSKAFKEMLISQQHQMDKQEELFSVSGKVAGQLNAKDALHSVMAAFLKQGASSVRVVFYDNGAGTSPRQLDHRLGLGKHSKLLETFDQDVVELSQESRALVLRGDDLSGLLPGVEGFLDLNAVIILPLKWKDIGLGVLWVAFADGFDFDEKDLRYFEKLAHLACLAIVNAKTYSDSQSAQMLLDDIFDLIPEAILIIDRNGKVLLHNNKANSVLGLAGGSFVGKSMANLLKPEDLVEIEHKSGSKPMAKSVHLMSGKEFHLITSPVRINQREVGRAMIFKDLTHDSKTESLKTELVTTVSHELRSPLTLILGYAKILRLTGTLNDQQEVYISNIIDGLSEMMSLVEKLLDIGRLEGGDPLDVKSFSVETFARHLVKSMDAQARQKNIQINLDLPEIPMTIEADQTFLTQALKNLLDNAIKVSKMGGEVIVRVMRVNDRVVFAVQDEGIGIAPLDQRKLFKKFSRVSVQNSQEQEGSGLGLAIVKSIAERHGGQVRLESQLGKGSTFFVEIPLKQPQ